MVIIIRFIFVENLKPNIMNTGTVTHGTKTFIWIENIHEGFDITYHNGLDKPTKFSVNSIRKVYENIESILIPTNLKF